MSDGALPGDAPLGFEILDSERLADGFRAMDRLTVRHASLVGDAPLTVKREITRARDAAVVIPYDPALNAIVTIRQFRIGAALSTRNAAPLELPAGLIDEGESPREAALRELTEETGLTARAANQAFSVLTTPGVTDERIFVFLALVDASHLDARAGLAEEHEEIVPLSYGVDALIEACDAGRIENGFLFASLQWFARRGREEAARLRA
ncbi:NUDIX domain-containing protein [Aureimonas mangrovi]|uniref:NUDIX domain-containing protein n=1 Tax=Aureimonas mangrovi TaxID=2758041 RepID=UPI00248419A1|nr:NUDIX domain-containing protein [Aureimonas mangrovi]